MNVKQLADLGMKMRALQKFAHLWPKKYAFECAEAEKEFDEECRKIFLENR